MEALWTARPVPVYLGRRGARHLVVSKPLCRGHPTVSTKTRGKSLFFLSFAAVLAAGAPSRAGQVRVILWFDTEDFLLPADDDATLRLAELLSARGVRATFKLVGEKARVLERRGRTDVI